MSMLLSLIGLIAGIGSLICFIMVLIKMFQHGKTGLGIACIVLIFCFGIGGIVAFVYGWMKATEWNIKNVMIAWTACFVIGLICNGANFAMGGVQLPAQ